MLHKLILDASAFINCIDLSNFYPTNSRDIVLSTTDLIENEISNILSSDILKIVNVVSITKEQISKIRTQLKKICPKEALLLSDADLSLIQLYIESIQHIEKEDFSSLSFNTFNNPNKLNNENALIDIMDGGWVTEDNINNIKENSFSERDNKEIKVVVLTADKALIKAMSLLGYYSFYTDKEFSIHNINSIKSKVNIISNTNSDSIGKLICRTCKFVQEEGSYFCNNCSNINLKRLNGSKSDDNLNWKSKRFNVKTKIIKGRKPLIIRRPDQLEFELKKARWNKRKEPKIILTPKTLENKRFGRARKEGIN